MKCKKYIGGAVLSAALLLQTGMPVLAAEETPTADVTETQEITLPDAAVATTGSATVEYNGAAEQNFTVTIPKKIVLGTDKTAEYNVTVKGDVATGSTVNVAPHDDVNDVAGTNFVMSVASGKTGDPVNVNVTQADTNWDYAAITAVDASDSSIVTGTAKSGNIAGPDLTKGIWSGTLTFDITFNDEYAGA